MNYIVDLGRCMEHAAAWLGALKAECVVAPDDPAERLERDLPIGGAVSDREFQSAFDAAMQNEGRNRAVSALVQPALFA